MSESLRPMSTGELMDATVTLYRKNFFLFVGIATIGPAAGVLFQVITVGSGVVLQRMRKEAFDLELMLSSLEAPAPPPVPAPVPI